MLSETHKQKLDEATVAAEFRNSRLSAFLNQTLESFRLDSIRLLETTSSEAEMLEGVRILQSINRLIQYIQAEVESKLAQVDEVADELGIDLDDLTLRRELDV